VADTFCQDARQGVWVPGGRRDDSLKGHPACASRLQISAFIGGGLDALFRRSHEISAKAAEMQT
jgi:hypothetical protein